MYRGKDVTTPNEAKEIIELGKAALKRIVGRAKLDFMDWFKVGSGIKQGAVIVAASLRMNSPDSTSTIFNRAFKAWRARNGYGAIDQAKGGKVTLNHLSNIMDHREEVLAWFNGLTDGERLDLKHPSTVWRHYSKHLQDLEKAQEEPEGDDDMDDSGADDGPVPDPLVDMPPLPPLPEVLPLADNDELAAMAFFDTYGDRADAVLKAILKMRRLRRRK